MSGFPSTLPELMIYTKTMRRKTTTQTPIIAHVRLLTEAANVDKYNTYFLFHCYNSFITNKNLKVMGSLVLDKSSLVDSP